MDGRSYTLGGSKEHRYGFNGKERDMDGEWGDNTHYDYGFRIYNPAIAKFLSIDPLSPDYPMLTPYQFAHNSPIFAIDLDGLEAESTTEPIFDESASNNQKNDSSLIDDLSNDGTAGGGPLPDVGEKRYYRGDGENAPYFYEDDGALLFKKQSGDRYNTATVIVRTNIKNNHVLVHRFMNHWDLGNGGVYQLTESEVSGLIFSYNLAHTELNNQINSLHRKNMSSKSGYSSEYIIFPVDASSAWSATVGSAQIIHKGVLTVGPNGNWNFTGQAQLQDDYDFNWFEDNGDLRDNLFETILGDIINGFGNEFPVRGPWIDVQYSREKHNSSGPTQTQSTLRW